MDGPFQTNRIQLVDILLFQLIFTIRRTLAINPSTQRSRRIIHRSVVGRNISIPFSAVLSLFKQKAVVRLQCAIAVAWRRPDLKLTFS